MKKMILGVCLASALVLMSGCGDSDDDKVAIEDVTVEYKASGTYDMSEYMLPAQSQISNYVETTFTNNKGKKEYKAIADKTTYPSVKLDVNASIVKEYKEDSLDVTNTIFSDRIRNVDADDNSSMDIARFVDKGDYVQKVIETFANGATLKMACKLDGQIASKAVSNETYNDVIKIVCDIKASRENTKLNGTKSIETLEVSNIAYFAKNQGLISSLNESCTSTKEGDKTTTDSCEKVIQNITTIN